MATHGIHGNVIEITVVSCYNLKDTEWISRQDPYVFMEYGDNKSMTRTCTDGGKNPTFQEKFVYSLIEGLRELNVSVWNSNTLTHDDFIGSGRIPLAKALSKGFDDNSWPLQTKTGRHAGEVRLIMHYSNGNKPGKDVAQKPLKDCVPSVSPYVAQGAPLPGMYSAPPPIAYYPPPSGAYPSSASPAYPPNPSVYSAPPYPPQAATYPPPPYPPNPAYGSQYPPGSPFPGYPPPPYY